MNIVTTVLDLKLCNTFEEYEAHMKSPEQQAMFNEMGVKIFNIGRSLDDPKRSTVMFQGSENVLCDIFINPEKNQFLKPLDMFIKGQKSLVGSVNQTRGLNNFDFRLFFAFNELSIINRILFFWNYSL